MNPILRSWTICVDFICLSKDVNKEGHVSPMNELKITNITNFQIIVRWEFHPSSYEFKLYLSFIVHPNSILCRPNFFAIWNLKIHISSLLVHIKVCLAIIRRYSLPRKRKWLESLNYLQMFVWYFTYQKKMVLNIGCTHDKNKGWITCFEFLCSFKSCIHLFSCKTGIP